MHLLLTLLYTAQATETDTDTPRFQTPNVMVEGMTLAMADDFTGMGGVALLGERGTYARIDARSQATGDWVGRVGIGKDVFGRWDFFDLTVGASLGAAGDWHERAMYQQIGAGLNLGVGINVRRVHLSASRVQPFSRSPVSHALDESQVRLAFDVNDQLTLFGTSLRVYPDFEGAERRQAYGVGASYVF